MAIYRTVSMNFWTDSKVVDEFTPEDRYFYLYLFTNPHTNLSGCYEISIKQMSNELGYNADVINNLINRFIRMHNVIRYSAETKEMLLLNWYKYNWTASDKFKKPLLKEIQKIKTEDYRIYLQGLYDEYGTDTVSIRYPYGIDTTVTVSDTVSDTVTVSVSDINSNSISNKDVDYNRIIEMYNSICISYPRVTTLSDARKRAIRARLKMYTYDDFKVLFEKAEESTFLKGGNDRNWAANFDWLIKDSNMAKVLDGNYANKNTGSKVAQELDRSYEMYAQWAERS